jgi:sulfur carrier protein ThiS
MAPVEDQIRVSARITKELDARICQHYASVAQAINEALERLAEIKEGTVAPSGTIGTNSDATHKSTGSHDANIGTSNYAGGDNHDANGASELKSRLSDALAQVGFLKGQIAIKDNQIAIKDQQIDKQAFSLQSVIQENSRLNIKLLPETTEKSKPWWRFW